MTEDEMRAREAIRKTAALYTSAADRGAYDELVDVFTEDAVMAVGESFRIEGRDKIIALLFEAARNRRAGEKGHFQRSLAGNPNISIDGPDSARAVLYVMVTTELGHDHSGTYIDRYRRSGDRWLLAHRVAHSEWVHVDSRFRALPGPLAPLDPERLALA